MIIGLALMLFGYFTEAALPTGASWSPEQAAAFQKASAELHGASYGKEHDHSKEHSHGEADRSSREYLKAKEEFEKSRNALERAYSRRTWIKYGVILTGVLIAGYGIVVVGIDKMKADDALTKPHKPKKH